MAWSLDHAAPGFRPAWFAGTPWLTLATLAGFGLTTASLAAGGWAPPAAARAGAVAALQGGLLATALAWTARDERAGAAWNPGPAILVVLTLVAGAATLTEIDDRLGVAWTSPLAVYGWLAASGRLRELGLGGRRALAAAVPGLALGAALGAHMLLAASLTFNHRLRGDGALAYLSALGYDAGVNVPASEAFFRGALLRRAHARTGLAGAIVLTMLASAARYVLDPRLPAQPEARLGAAMYLGLLGGASAWLVTRTGSLAPALAASLTFFAFYRLLGPP